MQSHNISLRGHTPAEFLRESTLDMVRRQIKWACSHKLSPCDLDLHKGNPKKMVAANAKS